jgi:hypothetical protein
LVERGRQLEEQQRLFDVEDPRHDSSTLAAKPAPRSADGREIAQPEPAGLTAGGPESRPPALAVD